MRCPVREGHPELLLDFCARSLPADTAAILEHHLTRCPECSRLAESQEAVWSALDSWKPERISDAFDEKLYEKIQAEPQRRFRRVFHTCTLNWRPALTIALAGCVMAMALLIPASSSQPPAAPPQESSLSDTLEPEQVDRTTEDLEMLRQFSMPARQSRI